MKPCRSGRKRTRPKRAPCRRMSFTNRACCAWNWTPRGKAGACLAP
ncbi:MAG: hypothetical protein MZV63_07225 [Marinilabiliales bacterium]|nr:hypothetical protein [Marinilabiliales bacterium]